MPIMFDEHNRKEPDQPKTGKREYAVAVMVQMYLLVGFTMWALYEAGNTEGMISLVTIIVVPSFAVFASAFALDAFFKQGPEKTNGQIYQNRRTASSAEKDALIPPPPKGS